MKKDKPVKKKNIFAALLLTVYSVFLVQEVVLNRVLCFKTDGSVDVELAYWGFVCECKYKTHNHKYKDTHKKHRHIENKNNPSQDPEKEYMEVEAECCYDVPVNNSLLTGESNANLPEPNNRELFNVQVKEKILLHDPYTGFPEHIPISKFLISFPFQCSTVILRC